MEEGGLFVQDTPFAKGGGGGVFVVGGVEQWGEVFRVSGVVLGVVCFCLLLFNDAFKLIFLSFFF